MKSLWPACAHRLQTELPEPIFRTWIRPLVCLSDSASEAAGPSPASGLRLGVANRVKLDWIRTQYGERIAALACEIAGMPVTVSFELASVADPDVNSGDEAGDETGKMGEAADPAEKPVAGLRTSTQGATGMQAASLAMVRRGSEPEPRALDAEAGSITEAAISAAVDRSRLNPELTFETFVNGKANALARAAALQVAERPGGAYNPLFLYGGVGLGKTHLIHAVGHAIVARNPAARVRYITANQFFQDMVSAIRRQSVDDFKRYYHTLDLLLIDDIQFFAGKERSQEEFFYAFENLIAERKQILITSDAYPREMSNIDDRLVSRFNSGLIVAIEPPELEMRVAILLRKAEIAGIRLGDDVAFFVAKHIRQNVRELEGALRRILAYADFRQAPVSLELVREALKDLLSYNRGQISVEFIQKTVADFYKIKIADMYSKRRPANIALPRQVAMYLAKELTQKSLPEIGELFGGRDHTTVLHAVRKIAQLRQHRGELEQSLHVLEQTLREYL